jgi:hypothetical protein
MGSLEIYKIVCLVICIEYILLILFLLYNLHSNFNSSKPFNYFSLYHYFSIILCILKVVVYIFVIQDFSNQTVQIIGILVYSLYFTVLTIISSSWYLIIRNWKYIKYDFSLGQIQRNSKLDQLRRFFMISNFIVYLVGFGLIALIMIDYAKTGETYLSNLPVNGYNIITRIVLFSYMFTSAFRLLKMIKKYTSMRPTKLVWNIYIIISMVGIYIPYHVIQLTIDLFGEENNNEALM